MQRSPVFRFSRWPGLQHRWTSCLPRLMVHDVVWSAIGIPCRGCYSSSWRVWPSWTGDPMRASLVFPAMSGWTVGAELLLMLRADRGVGVRGSRSAVPQMLLGPSWVI